MEKRGNIEPGVTPGEPEPRAQEGTLADYQKKYGEKEGQAVFDNELEFLARLDENHPTRRAIKRASEDLK